MVFLSIFSNILFWWVSNLLFRHFLFIYYSLCHLYTYDDDCIYDLSEVYIDTFW